MQVDRKWIVVEPSMTQGEGSLPINSPWTNNNYINIGRLFNAKRFHILSPFLWKEKADAYYLISCINASIDKEIEFVDKVHKEGSKVFLAVSIDSRFYSGHGLSDFKTGTLYTELCKRVDAISSGVSEDLHIYADSQHKVVPVGDFVEKLNFATIPYEQRTIDCLGTGHADETTLPFNLVFYLMLKEKYPNKRLVYAFRNSPAYDPIINLVKNKYPQLEFTKEPYHELLKNSKVYINLEPRPRPGRAVLEAWYHRVPSISCTSTYFSKLYPEFSFKNISYDKIIEAYERLVNFNYNELMTRVEKDIEYDSAQNTYNRIIKMLDGK